MIREVKIRTGVISQNSKLIEIGKLEDIAFHSLIPIARHSDRYLIGDWMRVDGGEDKKTEEWAIDKNKEFAGFYNADANTIQVIWSKWIMVNVQPCSPCYPDQGNLEEFSQYGFTMCYCLPLHVFKDEEFVCNRIICTDFMTETETTEETITVKVENDYED